MWTRLPELLTMSAPTLAVLGDYVPARHRHDAHDRHHEPTASTTPCGWLASCPPSGCWSTSGSTSWPTAFGHGQIYLWAEDGTLMATASQSAIDPRVEGEVTS